MHLSELSRVVMIVPSTVKSIKLLRDGIKDFLVANDVKDEDTLYDFQLVVAEAAINVIKHTYRFDDSKIITCTLKREKNSIEIDIRDFGPKIDENNLKPRDLSETREGGLGLYLIHSLVDEWEYEKVCKGNMLVLRREIF